MTLDRHYLQKIISGISIVMVNILANFTTLTFMIKCLPSESYISIILDKVVMRNTDTCKPKSDCSYNIGTTYVFHALTFAGSRGGCLNTRPLGRVFKYHPRDPESVNAMKQKCVIVILAYFT